VWSVGCILLELYTGRTCFQTHSNLEHLAMMEALLGPFSTKWIRSQTNTKNNTIFDYFEPKDRESKTLLLKWYNEASSESKKRVRRLKKLSDLISKEHHDFLDLITKTLRYDPSTRITASEALDHVYFDSVREKYRTKNETKELKKTCSGSGSFKEPRQPDHYPELPGSFMSTSRANSLSLSGSKIGKDSHETGDLKEKNHIDQVTSEVKCISKFRNSGSYARNCDDDFQEHSRNEEICSEPLSNSLVGNKNPV